MATKKCADCQQVKALDDFGLDSRMAQGRKSYCRPCLNVRAKATYQRDAAGERERRRVRNAARRASGAPRPPSYWSGKLRQYGITPDDYERMLREQAGACAICRATEPKGRGQRFHVDHDHQTGRVRGLLCHGCNVGIGHLGDSVDRIRAVLDYIQGPSS